MILTPAPPEAHHKTRFRLAGGGVSVVNASGMFGIGRLESGDSGDWSLASFFGGGSGSTTTTCTSPVIKNALLSSRGTIRMDAKGSCIQTGATVKLQVPFSTTTFGPFNLQSDTSGTLVVGAYDGDAGVQPVGTCRIFTVTNPDGKVSNSVTLCR